MSLDYSWCSHTLYVVRGAYKNPCSTFATSHIEGKQCPEPIYYFKVLVPSVKAYRRHALVRLFHYRAVQLKFIGFSL